MLNPAGEVSPNTDSSYITPLTSIPFKHPKIYVSNTCYKVNVSRRDSKESFVDEQDTGIDFEDG